MNILMALSQVEVTGAEVYAVTLADSLIERGHMVFIASDTLTKSTKAAFTPIPFNERSLRARLRHIRRLVSFIHRHNIHVIHAHSRAAGWCAYFAAQIAGIPLVTTVHGRQPTHFSRKFLKAFGDVVLPICEAVRDNIVHELGVHPRTVQIVRNGVSVPCAENTPQNPKNSNLKIISLIGRLSKEKGDLAYKALEALLPAIFENTNSESSLVVRVIGGREIPERFQKFLPHVEFTGYVDNVSAWIALSDVVIGAGRSAIEGILMGKPTIAVGEAWLHGLVTRKNLAEVLQTNFGDIATQKSFDWAILGRDVQTALRLDACDEVVQQTVRREFSIETLTNSVESAYQTALVQRYRYEMPILTYHRIVRTPKEGGALPIWVTAEQFEQHLQFLKQQGFQTTTFRDLDVPNRFEDHAVPHRTKPKKRIILSFDDGYEDNYTLLFPLLKKYGMTAVIFLVADRTENTWDNENISGLPPLKLLNTAQILEMQEYGIEFGSHTLTHPHLPNIPLEQAQREITESKLRLEERLGRLVQTFCYPYGALNEQIKVVVREAGYKYGIASDSGGLALHEDLLEIRRIGVFPNTTRRGFARKITGKYSFRKVR